MNYNWIIRIKFNRRDGLMIINDNFLVTHINPFITFIKIE